ncbi:uncharacterized protein LOC112127753 [Cimex lectularius]|uniref:Uncharacterized protein n=1 Tax=Cimex lectularius TaxID=79782 RepID=A0A8I6STA8_CIMLE|nr:uncharacterized protein LOC112127753 [Cimex lectularius]
MMKMKFICELTSHLLQCRNCTIFQGNRFYNSQQYPTNQITISVITGQSDYIDTLSSQPGTMDIMTDSLHAPLIDESQWSTDIDTESKTIIYSCWFIIIVLLFSICLNIDNKLYFFTKEVPSLVIGEHTSVKVQIIKRKGRVKRSRCD